MVLKLGHYEILLFEWDRGYMHLGRIIVVDLKCLSGTVIGSFFPLQCISAHMPIFTGLFQIVSCGCHCNIGGAYTIVSLPSISFSFCCASLSSDCISLEAAGP